MREVRHGPELRVAGRTLTGPAIVYGDVSPDYRERFEAGAFAPVPAVPLNLQHDPATVILAPGAFELRDTPAALEVRAELPERSAALALVRRGALNGLSVEFKVRSEHRASDGVRVVERAVLTGIGLVDRGAYPGSKVEVRRRRGRTIRQTIPADTDLGCECASAECKWARLVAEPLREAIEGAYQDAVEVLGVRANYGTPLASKSKGSVRARIVGKDAEVGVDLPDGPDGDAVLRDAENAGIVLRPYLDRDLSDGSVENRAAPDAENRVMTYSKIVIRSFVIGATDARAGWPEPELIPTPDEYMAEGRRVAPRRRRLWL